MPAGMELSDYGRLKKDSELKIQSHDTANKKVRQPPFQLYPPF